MDLSGGWKQHEGLQGAGRQENNGKTGNLGLQEGELPKSSMYCLRSRRWTSQCQGSLKMLNGGKTTIKHKRKLIMITGKEADHLHWQLGCNIACILVLKRYVGQAVDQKGSQSGPRPEFLCNRNQAWYLQLLQKLSKSLYVGKD